MHDTIRIVLISIAGIFLISIVTLLLFLLISILVEFKPAKEEVLDLQGNANEKNLSGNVITLLSWNIGYASMGAETDFFYDGGKMVRPSKDLNAYYLENIESFLRSNDTLDFIFLQEVDKFSKRSYFIDQTEVIRSLFPDYSSVFAKNYHVFFVPVPLRQPMGKVQAGLMSLSKFEPLSSARISFPGNYRWPTRMFSLKRCFIIQRFNTGYGKELVLINTHNSAFDDGTLRMIQLEKIKEIVTQEYQKGNFVIVGGDWNMNPPGFNPSKIANGETVFANEMGNIPEDFMHSGWQWIYDPLKPTNRQVISSYVYKETPTTILDFFLVSPNLKVLSVEAIDQSFAFSDHNPLIVKLMMLKNE